MQTLYTLFLVLYFPTIVQNQLVPLPALKTCHLFILGEEKKNASHFPKIKTAIKCCFLFKGYRS